MDKASYTPIGNILSSFMDENLSSKAGRVSSFFKSWRHIAGERLAAHSRVSEVENGIVIVEADHPSWIQLLQMRQEEMLIAVKKGWPELEIRGIAFRIPRTGPAPARDAKPAVSETPPADRTDLADEPLKHAYKPVTDGRLAAALERLKKSVSDRGKPKG